jgi:hypothetical protein
MAIDNVLAEKEFDVSLDGQTHKVKATAVFIVHGFTTREVGEFFLNFTLRGHTTETFRPDKTRYSREEARRVAGLAFSSGYVEALTRRKIQVWINLGH